MPTSVKAHRRGKSVVKAYKRMPKTAKQINTQIYEIRQKLFARVTSSKGSPRRIAQLDKVRHKLFDDRRYWGL